MQAMMTTHTYPFSFIIIKMIDFLYKVPQCFQEQRILTFNYKLLPYWNHGALYEMNTVRVNISGFKMMYCVSKESIIQYF